MKTKENITKELHRIIKDSGLTGFKVTFEVEVDKPKRWRGDKHELYYYISAEGNLHTDTDHGFKADNFRFKTHNYFRTGDEAIEHLEGINFVAEVREWLEDQNGDWIHDWDQYNEKFRLTYSSSLGMKISQNIFVIETSKYKYAKSGVIIRDMIDKFDNDMLIKYWI